MAFNVGTRIQLITLAALAGMAVLIGLGPVEVQGFGLARGVIQAP